MNRRNQILAAILVLQLILVTVVFWPRSQGSAQEGQALFPGLAADQVVRLTITSGTGSIQLAKAADGWALPGADDYPVLADRVPALLGKIVELKADRPVTTSAGSHKRLKVAVDDYERLVEFDLADGSHHRLYVGSSPSYGAGHVRADDQAKVYLASGFSAQDAATEPTSWVDRTYLSVPQDQAMALVLENAQGRFEFDKSSGTWAMAGLAAGETLDESKVTSLLGRVSALALKQPLGKQEKAEYGLLSPAATLTIVTRSAEGVDKTYTLRVGAKDAADSSYVVSSSESAYFVRVAEYSLKDLVEFGRESFLKLPPTPTPEATPQG